MVKQTTERATVANVTHDERDAKRRTTTISTAITYVLFVQQSKDIVLCYIPFLAISSLTTNLP